MKRLNVEMAVGAFMLVGFLCFAWLSVKLGDVDLFGRRSYSLAARFGSVSGLKEGAIVEIAGVQVGKVAAIRLSPQDYEAVVEMSIDEGVRLSEDSIASIRTAGIIGDRYVKLSPGGMPQYLAPGATITETESAINIEELISKYIFEKK